MPLDGIELDAGCEVADEAHWALLSLAAELDVATRLSEPWPDDLAPPLEGADLELFLRLQEKIDGLAARVDPLHPDALDGAGALDAQTLGGWLSERGASAGLLAIAETWYAVASSTAPIEHMSLLAYATKLAAGAAPNGLRIRFDGGPTALVERMAAALGDRLKLDEQVVAIEDDGTGIRVHLAGGAVERGAVAIVALPLTVQRALRFEPALPQHRADALALARYGDAVKAGLVYDVVPERPYPAIEPTGVLYRPEPERPLVVFFAGSGPARYLAGLPEEHRRREIARLGGGSPRAVFSVAWSREPFTLGSYLILGPGDLTTWGRRLPEPHGRIHFAGSEASPLPSYMNGAVLAGERAAQEVLGDLG